MLRDEVAKLKEKIKEYEDNKEVIENLEGLTSGKLKTQKEIDAIQKQLDVCNQETLELYKSHGSLEQKLANLKEKKQELETLRQEHATYDLYQQCMKSSGISYDIIKKKLPVINNEIAKVLTSVVDFEVFFEEESKRLNIFIKHPKFDARPLEMGSGVAGCQCRPEPPEAVPGPVWAWPRPGPALAGPDGAWPGPARAGWQHPRTFDGCLTRINVRVFDTHRRRSTLFWWPFFEKP